MKIKVHRTKLSYYKDMRKIADYINNHLDIGEEYRRIFNKEMPNGKFFCPFHENVNTPSAKRYGNRIKCFGLCGRWYSVYDLLKHFNLSRIDEISSTVIVDPALKLNTKERFKSPFIDRESINKTSSKYNYQ